MAYVVKPGKGKKKFNIVNQKTGQVVGSSDSLAKAHRSIKYRTSAEANPKNIKSYKRKVDNKMHSYGETDLEKKIVRINKSKKKNKPGDIIDTIVHEKEHILHPKKHEKTVRRDTVKKLKKMTRKQKQKNYSLFKT